MGNDTTESGLSVEPGSVAASRDRRAPLLYPILLLLIVIGFYWKLSLTNQFEWMGGGDLVVQVLPWFEEETRQLQQGWLPLWDPHNWAGQPIVGQGQPGAAYPLNWLLFSIPRYRGHIAPVTLHWYYIAMHYMAALFSYLLCRDLGCSKPAALIGGLVFSFASYVWTTEAWLSGQHQATMFITLMAGGILLYYILRGGPGGRDVWCHVSGHGRPNLAGPGI